MIGNPRRAIADRVELTQGTKPRFRGTAFPLPPTFLNPAGKISPEYRGHTALRVDEIEAHFFPTQYYFYFVRTHVTIR